jgi:hypothetical protein
MRTELEVLTSMKEFDNMKGYAALQDRLQSFVGEDQGIFVELVRNLKTDKSLAEIPGYVFPKVFQAYRLGRDNSAHKAFISGFNTVLQEGNVEPWAESIIDYFKKDTIGGGNYREVFG